MGEKNHRIAKVGWFFVMFLNFAFGLLGVIICTMKLRYVDDEDIRVGFFKVSMIFAVLNLLLSVLLLVSVLKRDQKYAFIYALLIFLSLFAATLHIESHTTKSLTFIIIFSVFAGLCFMWFCVYGAYQYWLEDNQRCESAITDV